MYYSALDFILTACYGSEHMFEMIAEATRLVRQAVVRLQPASTQGDEAARAFEAFAELERLAAAGRIFAARQVEKSKVWQRDGHRTAAEWVAKKAGMTVGQAIGVLETAGRVEELPATRDALRAGALSEAQTREIAGAASVDPSAETMLLAAARSQTISGLRQTCARVKAAATADEAAAYRRIHESRYLRHWTDPEGAVRLDARLTPDVGAAVIAAVEARQDVLFARARRNGQREPSQAHAADALFELLCESSSAGVQDSGRPAPVVHVMVDHSALVRGSTVKGERCEIPGVGPVPVATARSLAADSLLNVLVTDGADVKAVAHAGRTISAKLRTALEVRDPVCAIEGCTVRKHLEIDHVVPYGNGGRTELDNLCRLCRWHHYLKTHCGYSVSGQPGARQLVTPDDRMGARPPPAEDS